MDISLIANTGLQYLTCPLDVDLNNSFKMYFHEWFDTNDGQLKLEIAHYFAEDEVWVKKHDLALLGYIKNGKVSDNWEAIKSDFHLEGKSVIPIESDEPEKSGCFQVSCGRIKWEKFENRWFPFPFFMMNNNQSKFGPTNWCRFKLIPATSAGKVKKYDLLLAFDTRTQFENEDFEDEDLNETPVFASSYERSKDYAACNNEYMLVDYCSKHEKGRDRNNKPLYIDCEWVDGYILKTYHNIDNINDTKLDKPKLHYLAQYIYIIRYIQQSNCLPKITLYSNKNIAYVNVDLVVDIGNSCTCAALFDEGDFTKTSPLELQDFTVPVSNGALNRYADSFNMRLAFREADFGGKFGIGRSRQFVYPSMVRLGKEANRLIHQATNLNMDVEKTSTCSSPKRFLWDKKPQKQEWEFVRLEGEKTKPIYIERISEQLNADGSLNIEGDGGILMHYSRKALMTLAFLEILAQAKMQINSYEQRHHWGKETTPRQIGRIIVTCPTAMSRVEQIALRKCAEDAAIILDRFFDNIPLKILEEKDVRGKTQVIPSVKNLSSKDERTEWIYDEATCAQFVFLYAEIGKRYLKNVKEYFDFYGKVRTDLDDYNKKSLTIGSVDIGAGTTDVMIAAYKYDDAGQCTLTPVPLFWESFYKAGDDLLKELIRQLVIEGQYSPIETKLKSMGRTPNQIVQLNNDFFGDDNGMSFLNRQLRSDFNLQISVPLASYFLELLKTEVDDRTLSFTDIFGDNMPVNNVLAHFNHHFGFEFESLQWRYEHKTVASIVKRTFDTLIGQISSVFSYYACDIVLLSGRPTSLRPLTDLFLEYYAIAPNRLKSINSYRVGRWYPQDKRHRVIDGNGYFIDPKSIITIGAMIGNCASTKGSLDGFSLNLKELVEKQTPTTEYFGKLDVETMKFIETNISPDENHAVIEISSLPLRIGCRQLNTDSYLSRPFYTLDFNIESIEDKVCERLDNKNDINAIQQGIDAEIYKVRRKMPLKVTVERDYNDDKELLRIESITNRDGDNLSVRLFNMQIQSMSEMNKFWLDSGIFHKN
jgi:hypothetical protein